MIEEPLQQLPTDTPPTGLPQTELGSPPEQPNEQPHAPEVVRQQLIPVLADYPPRIQEEIKAKIEELKGFTKDIQNLTDTTGQVDAEYALVAAEIPLAGDTIEQLDAVSQEATILQRTYDQLKAGTIPPQLLQPGIKGKIQPDKLLGRASLLFRKTFQSTSVQAEYRQALTQACDQYNQQLDQFTGKIQQGIADPHEKDSKIEPIESSEAVPDAIDKMKANGKLVSDLAAELQTTKPRVDKIEEILSQLTAQKVEVLDDGRVDDIDSNTMPIKVLGKRFASWATFPRTVSDRKSIFTQFRNSYVHTVKEKASIVVNDVAKPPSESSPNGTFCEELAAAASDLAQQVYDQYPNLPQHLTSVRELIASRNKEFGSSEHLLTHTASFDVMKLILKDAKLLSHSALLADGKEVQFNTGNLRYTQEGIWVGDQLTSWKDYFTSDQMIVGRDNTIGTGKVALREFDSISMGRDYISLIGKDSIAVLLPERMVAPKYDFEEGLDLGERAVYDQDFDPNAPKKDPDRDLPNCKNAARLDFHDIPYKVAVANGLKLKFEEWVKSEYQSLGIKDDADIQQWIDQHVMYGDDIRSQEFLDKAKTELFHNPNQLVPQYEGVIIQGNGGVRYKVDKVI